MLIFSFKVVHCPYIWLWGQEYSLAPVHSGSDRTIPPIREFHTFEKGKSLCQTKCQQFLCRASINSVGLEGKREGEADIYLNNMVQTAFMSLVLSQFSSRRFSRRKKIRKKKKKTRDPAVYVISSRSCGGDLSFFKSKLIFANQSTGLSENQVKHDCLR